MCKKQVMESNELRSLVEVERKAKEVAIQVSEEEHRRKFDQLKALVDQYRNQMQEYVKITQNNQEMLGRMSSTQVDIPILELVAPKEREVPILTGFNEPVVPLVKKEEIHKLMKRPQTAFSAIGSESVERQKGKKHYYNSGAYQHRN